MQPADLNRYHRQMLLAGFGPHGQKRLLDSTCLLVGCGALGSVLAEALVRAGVGRLRIVDRDVVEISNLQRQSLFEESDALQVLPKAVAARLRLQRINSDVRVEGVVGDFGPHNGAQWSAGCDLILDATDNFQTRYLINDLAVREGLPLLYCGAVAMQGMVYLMLPRTIQGDSAWEKMGLAGPCLRCLFGAMPGPGSAETCDTVGVLGPVATATAALGAAEAIKFLSGNLAQINRRLICLDLQENTIRQLEASTAAATGTCPCCDLRQFEALDGSSGPGATSLCGRDAVQIGAPTSGGNLMDLESVARRLGAHGPVHRNDFLLTATLQERGRAIRLTLFPDGRAILHGIQDPTEARSIYARYVGA